MINTLFQIAVLVALGLIVAHRYVPGIRSKIRLHKANIRSRLRWAHRQQHREISLRMFWDELVSFKDAAFVCGSSEREFSAAVDKFIAKYKPLPSIHGEWRNLRYYPEDKDMSPMAVEFWNQMTKSKTLHGHMAWHICTEIIQARKKHS